MRAEDRRNRTVTLRRRLLLGGWLLAGLVIVARSARLEVVEAAEWRRVAAEQHRASTPIPAPRGTILDRNGVPLAVSRERWKISVAPRELRDPAEARQLLREVLGVSRHTAERVTSPDDPWNPLPGSWDPDVREALAGVPGIHLERELQRFYPHGDLARSVLGHVLDGRGNGGIEEAYESLLMGTPGQEIVARDSDGREIPGEVFEVQPPVPGGEVRLTLDLDLQEIAQQALADAIAETEAGGGDVLVTDPRTGEILAMASFQDGSAEALSTVNTTYEPGSTLKPFTVAALLKTGTGSLADSVDTGVGYWRVHGRDLHDVGAHGLITLADALRVSSNIGIAKAAQALSHRQQYENLRDFGFGAPTGLPLPGEQAGTLWSPNRWSGDSPVSLAIGYEIAVTPLQMAMAYGALANGGTLMEPRLVREVRGPTGEVRERPRPRAVRRAIPSWVAQAVGDVLVQVVEDGTGTAARMSSFAVAGKSGTARAYQPGKGYVTGRYNASFVGYFPAEDPQLVIYVKLDRGKRYGGAVAAPVTRATMEAVLAARQAPIDRRALLEDVRSEVPRAAPAPGIHFASLGVDAPQQADGPAPDPSSPVALRDPATPVLVPDVSRLPARVAARRLHALGFRVAWTGSGAVVGTTPRAGARLVPGDTVRLRSGRLNR